MSIFYIFMNEKIETQAIEPARAESELNLVCVTPHPEVFKSKFIIFKR